MTDREPPADDEDGLDASDWLSAQFDPTGELPKQEPRPPAAPPARVPPNRTPPQAPVQPPAPPQQAPQQPPAQAPQIPPQFPPAQPPAAPRFPTVPPGAPVQPAFPPAAQQGPPQQPQPQQPVPPQAPVQPQQPQQPPQPQTPAQPQFPAQPQSPQPPFPRQAPPPAAAPPPAVPPAPAPGGGFSWGLTPGAAAPPPAVPPAPTTPPAPVIPPAATPPAATPAPAAPAAPWYRPAAQDPATPPAGQPPAAQPPAPLPPAPTPPAFPPAAAPTPAAPPAAAPTAAAPPVQLPPHPLDPTPLDTAIAGAGHEGEPPAPAMPFETTVLPDVAPGSRDAPPFWEPEPTQMMDALELEPDPPARTPQPVPTSVFPQGFGAAADPASPTDTEQVSAIDALFGETQFREYTEGFDQSQSPFARREVAPPEPTETGGGGPSGPPPGVSRVQKILLGVLGGILAVLALVALFILGTRLPDILGPAPAVSLPSASPSPSPSSGAVLGPVAPGDYHWDQLNGRECIDPYQSPWQDDYTVVDCATPHAAQLVRRAELPPQPLPTEGVVDDSYPGEDVLQAQAITLCRATGIFDSAASALTDAVIQVGYPVGPEAWDAGDRDYFCFVTRSSGEPITGDIALPPPAPAPPAPKIGMDPAT